MIEPVFAGKSFGIITRISTSPVQTPATLYGIVINGTRTYCTLLQQVRTAGEKS